MFDVETPRMHADKRLSEDPYLKDKTWEFLRLEAELQKQPDPTPAQKDLKEQLGVGSAGAFKIWKLNRWLKLGRWPLLAAGILLAGGFVIANRGYSVSITLGGVALCIIVAIIIVAIIPAVINILSKVLQKISSKFKSLAKRFESLLRWGMLFKSARSIARDILIAFIGFFIANIHLRTFDKMFIAHGKLSRLLALKRSKSD